MYKQVWVTFVINSDGGATEQFQGMTNGGVSQTEGLETTAAAGSEVTSQQTSTMPEQALGGIAHNIMKRNCKISKKSQDHFLKRRAFSI